MLIRSRRGWEMTEFQATSESVFQNRRHFLGLLGGAAAGACLGCVPALDPRPQPAPSKVVGLYPATPSTRYVLDRPITEEAVAAHHNIFDEFADKHEDVWKAAAGFRTDPWTIHIGGQVREAKTLGFTELIRRFPLEERVYRHRCVEAWAMAVPWTGFPLAKLVEFAEPLPKAKYLRMVSVHRAEDLPGWNATRRVFPYYEGLTLGEATNELAFLATGIYGHPLPPQHGAPLRLVVPWKYGFKSAKSIVAFEFTAAQPGTFWSELAPDSYDFLANVDPTTEKPWSQKMETMLGTGEVRPTLPYNGYGDFVGHLYVK